MLISTSTDFTDLDTTDLRGYFRVDPSDMVYWFNTVFNISVK